LKHHRAKLLEGAAGFYSSEHGLPDSVAPSTVDGTKVAVGLPNSQSGYRLHCRENNEFRRIVEGMANIRVSTPPSTICQTPTGEESNIWIPAFGQLSSETLNLRKAYVIPWLRRFCDAGSYACGDTEVVIRPLDPLKSVTVSAGSVGMILESETTVRLSHLRERRTLRQPEDGIGVVKL